MFIYHKGAYQTQLLSFSFCGQHINNLSDKGSNEAVNAPTADTSIQPVRPSLPAVHAEVTHQVQSRLSGPPHHYGFHSYSHGSNESPPAAASTHAAR